MIEENMKTSKFDKIYSLFLLVLLITIDVCVYLFARSSEAGFFTELGLKKGILLLLENVAIFMLILFQGRCRRKFCHKYWVKAVNILTVLGTPVLMLFMVQLLIGAGTYSMQTEYLLKNLLLYYAAYILFLLIFRKASVAISLYTIVLLILALVDYFVTSFRGNAFILMDVFGIGTATDVAGNYSFKLPVKTGICLLAMLIFLIYQLIFQSLEAGKRNLKGYVIRLGIVAVLLVGVGKNWNVIAGERVDQWDTAGEYTNKGYIYKLACETQYLEIEKPENYSTEQVNKIVETVKKNALTEENADDKASEGTKTQTVPKNLIVIMNESLTDFEAYDNFQASEAILPGIHSLQENTKKGYLYVPAFGGGTSDTEYEVLTGNTKEFLPNGGIAYQLYCNENEFGLANTMEQEGYTSTAIHPSWASAWNRANVYSWMNFEDFISIDNWGDDPKHYRWYVRDSSAYKKLKVLYKNKENENQFMFCVTIQNHGSYDPEKSKKFTADVKLSYAQEYPDAEIYLSLAKKSDDTFMKLLDFFKEVDEPTMIVMFGDHWPSLDWGFYSDVMGENFGTLDLIEKQQTYKTPYVLWTNYPSESKEEDMSANYFGSYILEQAGLEMTTYNKFLLQLKETIPVIGMGAVCDADGNWYAMDALPEEYEKLINDYKVLQYNNVVDRKHRVDSAFELSAE